MLLFPCAWRKSMSILNFEDPPKKKSPLKLIAISSLLFLSTVGIAVASLITLNTGNKIEFGQGSVEAVSCDSDGITVTPVQSFVNQSNSGRFTFNEVDIGDVSSTCAGKDFIIKLLDENGDVQNISADADGNPFNEVRVHFSDLSSNSDVTADGYFENLFTLVTAVTGDQLNVYTINNLDQKYSELDPDTGEETLLWDPAAHADARGFWEINATTNSFQIVLNPDPNTISGDSVNGFADARHVFHISIESVDHT